MISLAWEYDARASLLLISMSMANATTHKEGEDLEEREAPTFSFCFKIFI